MPSWVGSSFSSQNGYWTYSNQKPTGKAKAAIPGIRSYFFIFFFSLFFFFLFFTFKKTCLTRDKLSNPHWQKCTWAGAMHKRLFVCTFLRTGLTVVSACTCLELKAVARCSSTCQRKKKKKIVFFVADVSDNSNKRISLLNFEITNVSTFTELRFILLTLRGIAS